VVRRDRLADVRSPPVRVGDVDRDDVLRDAVARRRRRRRDVVCGSVRQRDARSVCRRRRDVTGVGATLARRRRRDAVQVDDARVASERGRRDR